MKPGKSSLYKDAVFDQCPSCKAIGALRRSRARNTFEQFIKKTGFYNMYRCRECGWRGKRASFSFKRITFKTIFIYLVMIAVSAFIISMIVKRYAF